MTIATEANLMFLVLLVHQTGTALDSMFGQKVLKFRQWSQIIINIHSGVQINS